MVSTLGPVAEREPFFFLGGGGHHTCIVFLENKIMFGRHRRGLSPILLIPTFPYLCEIGEVQEISISRVLKKTYNRLLLVVTKIRFKLWLLLIFVFRFLKNLQVIMTTILKSFRALSTIVMLQGLFLCIILYVERSLCWEQECFTKPFNFARVCHKAISELPEASFSKRVFMCVHSSIRKWDFLHLQI